VPSKVESGSFVAMPWPLSTVERIAAVTGRDRAAPVPLLERIADQGLLEGPVLSADNVQRNVTSICHCRPSSGR
jgi:hypothetical protein